MLGYVELADVVGNYDRAAKHAHGLDALRCAASGGDARWISRTVSQSSRRNHASRHSDANGMGKVYAVQLVARSI